MTACDCRPTEGYHQYNCAVSQRMRSELREAGKPPTPPDPTQRAKVRPPGYMDNPPACGAPKGWMYGYLPCGCRNDGTGRHIR